MEEVRFKIEIKGIIYTAYTILTKRQAAALKKRMSGSKPTVPEVRFAEYCQPYKK